MAEKKKVCRECGYYTDETKCSACGNGSFAEKHKGAALIINAKESQVAKKINAEHNGKYALKFN